MIGSILSILIVAILIPLLRRVWHRSIPYLLVLLPLFVFSYFGWQYSVMEGIPIKQSYSWNPYFDLSFAFYLDGLSLLFSLLISGIGVFIFLYAAHYMKDYRHQSRFFCFLTVFMGAMLGLVLADNLLTLIVFWEMTSITSFMLIGFEHQKKKARSAAYQGLLVTSFGGLALLAGLVMMGQLTGTNSISEITAGNFHLQEDPLYFPILLCVLLGAFTKSAQVPFHFWLPNAMAAPTPVSAYLHSATMVKAGVYVVARFLPVLGNTSAWMLIVSTVGGITMLTGAVMAFRSKDLKQILAYSTVSALGIMMLTLGIGTEVAVTAGMAYIVAHALYKSSLFMVIGIVDKVTGERNINQLPSMLYRSMKRPAIIAALAALSFAGIAPFFGFIAKELLLKMAIEIPGYNYLWITAIVIVAALFVAIALILVHATFFRKEPGTGVQGRPISPWLYWPPLITALAGLLFGVFSDSLSHLTTKAVAAIVPGVSTIHLALWHGWNLPLLLSLVSILAGVGVYGYFHQVSLNKTSWQNEIVQRFAPSHLYEKGIESLLQFARWLTGRLQAGHIRYYVLIVISTLLGLVGFTFFFKAGFRLESETIDMYFFEVVLGVILIVSLVFVIALKSEIGAILSLGIIAIVVSIIFLEYGAPDLAITWFLVDTLTITLFVMVVHKFPVRVILKSRIARWRDAAVSLGVGALMTLILFSLTYDPLQSPLKEFYAENTFENAHGQNMVNVILVDFRAFDTFGEIVVLTIAALGVYALVRYSKKSYQENVKPKTKD